MGKILKRNKNKYLVLFSILYFQSALKYFLHECGLFSAIRATTIRNEALRNLMENKDKFKMLVRFIVKALEKR